MTLAKAFVTGVVVKAPEKRFTQNDMAIADFSVNIDSNNETVLRVIAFGNLADTVASTLTVGDSVAVEGRLQANTYKSPSGKDKKIFEINANAVEKIGVSTSVSNPISSNTQAVETNKNQNIVTFSENEISEDLIDEDEIPF